MEKCIDMFKSCSNKEKGMSDCNCEQDVDEMINILLVARAKATEKNLKDYIV